MNSDQKHFYVTLFSTASHKIYKDNTLAAFTVHLAQTKELDSKEKWEVGLREFTCHPPKTGTFKKKIISDTNALIYFDLICHSLWVTN
jgi:hypothetical protein